MSNTLSNLLTYSEKSFFPERLQNSLRVTLTPYQAHHYRHPVQRSPQESIKLNTKTMLRVMKQKAQDHNEEMSQKRAAISTANLENSTPKVIVSHVPVSVGSLTHTSSATSSLSSKGDDNVEQHQSIGSIGVMAGPTDVAYSSTHVPTEDSKRESSPIVDASSSKPTVHNPEKESMASASTRDKRKNSRKVSFDESNKVHTITPPTKKPKLDLAPLHRESRAFAPNLPPLFLLARDQDEAVLSPLHVFVRNQIEVFTATPTELAQPAPGRKQPIKPHQVGLRCIHCRHLPNRKRVKRAVCYPSSVGRVYHSVSDMKFDHFSNCKELPPNARAAFEALKAEGKRNSDKKLNSKGYSSSTAQYYHDAAVQMGMMDSPGGIFLATAAPNRCVDPFVQFSNSLAPRQDLALSAMIRQFQPIHGLGGGQQNFANMSNMQSVLMSALAKNSVLGNVHKQSTQQAQPLDSQTTARLSSEEDSEYLNSLHCFVRCHVEVFTADKNDISAPAPGRKTRVVFGQVGIRCIHCAKLPVKQRVKRAVCYPPSVGGIYHSVSNMKFDHFGLCRALPPQAREEFTTLKSSCSRRGTAGNNSSRGGGSASSTAQYYNESAIRKGLVDSNAGIRFRTVQQQQARENQDLPLAQRQQLPTGMSALMMAASQAA